MNKNDTTLELFPICLFQHYQTIMTASSLKLRPTARLGLALALSALSTLQTVEAQYVYRRPRRRGGWRNIYLVAILVVSRFLIFIRTRTIKLTNVMSSPVAHLCHLSLPRLLLLPLQGPLWTTTESRSYRSPLAPTAIWIPQLQPRV